MEWEDFIYQLMDEEPNVIGGAIITLDGKIIYQTENWDLSEDVKNLAEIAAEAKKEGQSPGSLQIMKLKYMIVEFTPERVIATNVMRKGHIILAPFDKGALVTFIDPSAGPRDALFNVQEYARKLNGKL